MTINFLLKTKEINREKLKSKNVENKYHIKMEFYILELSVEQGGARKHDIYVLPTLKEVYRTLQNDLVRDTDLAIWYGEEIFLHRCKFVNSKKAKIIQTLDLHERLTFYVGEFPPIKFKNKTVVGYIKSNCFDKSYKSIDDQEPIDFTSNDLQEVYRYLHYDLHARFRIMKEMGINGSNIESYPPNVGVQIDLSQLPRIEEPMRYPKVKTFKIKLGDDTKTLSFGYNSLE